MKLGQWELKKAVEEKVESVKKEVEGVRKELSE